MSTEFDTSKPLRSLADLVNLTRFVLTADPHNESDWIEWKASLDLRLKKDQLAIAKQILGFGNRDPNAAARNVGGCGYLLLGVEPDGLVGQSQVDPANLQSGIERYVAHGSPHWSPTWVDVDGHSVLVITIEPPTAGDPIHTLRRSFDNAWAGQVFVRRAGGTHPASPAEVAMLAERFADRAAMPPHIEVRDISTEILSGEWSEEAVDSWIDRERRWLLEPLEPEEPESGTTELSESEARRLLPPGVRLEDLWKAQRQFETLAQRMSLREPETRSEELYRDAVDDYLGSAKEMVAAAGLHSLLEELDVGLCLELTNPTVRNLPRLQLVVDIEARAVDFEQVRDAARMPERPRRWGSTLRRPINYVARLDIQAASLLGTPTRVGSGFEVEVLDEVTRVVFDDVDMRPEQSTILPTVPLIVSSDLSGSRIKCKWTATSAAIDGVTQGGFMIDVSKQPQSILDELSILKDS